MPNDLMEDASFNLGVALSAMRIHRTGASEFLAKDLLYKSCLYATRDYLYASTAHLCLSYREIYQSASAQSQLFGEYLELIKLAYSLRNDLSSRVPPETYYKNISFINKFVLVSLGQGADRHEIEEIAELGH